MYHNDKAMKKRSKCFGSYRDIPAGERNTKKYLKLGFWSICRHKSADGRSVIARVALMSKLGGTAYFYVPVRGVFYLGGCDYEKNVEWHQANR